MLRPGDELVVAVSQVVPLTEHVLLLLGLHHVLLLQTLEGEHAGGVRLAVAVLAGQNNESEYEIGFTVNCRNYLELQL